MNRYLSKSVAVLLFSVTTALVGCSDNKPDPLVLAREAAEREEKICIARQEREEMDLIRQEYYDALFSVYAANIH